MAYLWQRYNKKLRLDKKADKIWQFGSESLSLQQKGKLKTTSRMKARRILLPLIGLMAITAQAQTTRTTEVQRDRYGHVTGKVETTVRADGTKTIVYRDQYGHVTGTAKSRTSSSGVVTTDYRDQYGHSTGSSRTTSPDRNGGTTTTYKDRYGHTVGTSTTRQSGSTTTTTYKDRYGHVTGTGKTR